MKNTNPTLIVTPNLFNQKVQSNVAEAFKAIDDYGYAFSKAEQNKATQALENDNVLKAHITILNHAIAKTYHDNTHFDEVIYTISQYIEYECVYSTTAILTVIANELKDMLLIIDAEWEAA